DVDIEIARRSAVRPRHTLAWHAQPLPSVDAGGERHQHLASLLDQPAPVTRVARISDDLALTTAARTSATEHHEPSLSRHLAAATTLQAWLGLRALLGPAAAALLTWRGAPNRNF